MTELNFEFEWVVEGFSTFKDSDRAKLSPTFEGPTSQYAWQLELTPRKKEEAISLYLYQTGIFPKSAKLMARFQVSLRDREGGLKNLKRGLKGHDFNEWSWGWESFISYASLADAKCSWVKDDTLRVHCALWVDADASLLANQISGMEDLGRLFREGQFADLDIVTDTKTFKAHKGILTARSKVFAAMLTTPMTEVASGSVTISDFNEDAVEGMLEFIYTGQVANLKEHAFSLLQIGDKYDLPGLKAVAEDSVINSLTVDNVTDALVLAHHINATFLKSKAIQFIRRNKEAVAKTEGFQNLGKSNPAAGMLMELYIASSEQ